jgi:DNA replication protein DnaC
MREYEKRRMATREEMAIRYARVSEKLPAYLLVEQDIAALSVGSGKKLLAGDINSLDEYKEKLNCLTQKKAQMLESAGFPDDYLEPIFTCRDCEDTGYINSHKCHCFKNLTISMLYQQSNLEEILQRENFDTFSFDYYSTNIIDPAPKSKLNSRELAEDSVIACKDFINTFNNTFQNIYLYGAVGVGKTFLINCIAKELLHKEHSVLYFSASDLINILVTSAFNKHDEGAGNLRELIFSCECLMIDDLGTEFTNTAVDAQLFICINERLLNNKSVIISSNLSPDNLKEKYDERITSRITGNYQILRLIGEDIRIQKRNKQQTHYFKEEL